MASQNNQDLISSLMQHALKLEPAQRSDLVAILNQHGNDLGTALEHRLARYLRFDQMLEDSDSPATLLGIPNSIMGESGEENADEQQVVVQPVLPKPPEEIDDFRILNQIGVGGQATVFLAEQRNPKRRVALKLMHGTGYPWSDGGLVRFQKEYQALAKMDHHHIAHIFGAGIAENGHPYFTMEWVDGLPITDYCRQNNLGLRDRLLLFGQVCEGVRHAHRRLVLHRDLKPNNILVAEVDQRATVKIIDFGVARPLSQNNPSRTPTLTDWMGTPEYMAPELLGDAAAPPDIRLDVYSLGVVLYEMLTHTTPFQHYSEGGAPPDEILRIYREMDPPKPSRKAAAESGAPHMRSLTGELDWIVMKAIAKEPDQRYASVVALLADCRAYLDHVPISAKPPGFWYVAKKFVRRNRIMVSAASLVLSALLMGLIFTTLAKKEAEVARGRFEKSFHALESVLTAPHALGYQAKVLDVLNLAEGDMDTALGEDPVLEHMIRNVWGNTYFALDMFPQALAQFEKTQRDQHNSKSLTPAHRALTDYYRARTFHRMGRSQEAALLLRRTLETQLAIEGMSEDTMNSLAYLITVLHHQNKAARAEQLLDSHHEAIAEMPDSAAKAQFLNAKATIQKKMGDRDGAGECFQKALLIQRSILGVEHRNTLATMSNYANLLRTNGDYETAEQLYRSVIQVRLKRFGEDHGLSLHAKCGLALVMEGKKQLPAAENLMREIIAKEWVGTDAKKARSYRRHLARILEKQDKLNEASEVLARLIRLIEDNGGADSFEAQKTKSNLGNLLVKQGRFEKAITLLQQAVRGMQAGPGKKSLNLPAAVMTLGQAFQEKGDFQVADSHYQQALSLLVQHRPKASVRHYYQAIRGYNLANSNRFDESESLMIKALEHSGPAFRDEILKLLINYYQQRGDQDKVETYRAKRAAEVSPEKPEPR